MWGDYQFNEFVRKEDRSLEHMYGRDFTYRYILVHNVEGSNLMMLPFRNDAQTQSDLRRTHVTQTWKKGKTFAYLEEWSQNLSEIAKKFEFLPVFESH